MKLAFVDNLAVGGGLSRFSLLLCKSLIEQYADLEIDYYVHFDNLKQIPEIFDIGNRVAVKVLDSSRPKKLSVRIAARLLSLSGIKNGERDEVLDEVEKRVDSSYDLAYFPSAHMMKRPELKTAVVGTIHDFNWMYFFGRQIFSQPFVKTMNVEVVKWMNDGFTICSSNDVVDEAMKLYPESGKYPAVVPIAPVIVNKEIKEDKAAHILTKLNIDFPYIIFPGNFFPHKNHLNLFVAFSLLKKRSGFEKYKLILTGMNSEQVKRGIATYRGVQLLTDDNQSGDFDVMGMGYQPNEVIDTLIAKARLLVSPSLYEAICTPGMDAWNFGTPTAISDIPPFREHEQVWGIRSAFFNPMDPENMADVMEAYLNDYPNAIADGQISKKNMGSYTWKQVAEGYMKVFLKATESK